MYDEEDDDAAPAREADGDEDEPRFLSRAARRCRRILCCMLVTVAMVAALSLLAIAYIDDNGTIAEEISFVTLGDWGCGPSNCLVPQQAIRHLLSSPDNLTSIPRDCGHGDPFGIWLRAPPPARDAAPPPPVKPYGRRGARLHRCTLVAMDRWRRRRRIATKRRLGI